MYVSVHDDMYTCNIGTGAARVKSERDPAAIGGAAHSWWPNPDAWARLHWYDDVTYVYEDVTYVYV